MLAVHFVLAVTMLYILFFKILVNDQREKIAHIVVVITGIMLVTEFIVGSYELHQMLKPPRYEIIYTILALALVLYASRSIVKIFSLSILTLFNVLIMSLGTMASFLLLGVNIEYVIVNPFYSTLGAMFGFLLFLFISIRLNMSKNSLKNKYVTLFLSAVSIIIYIYLADRYITVQSGNRDISWLITVSVLIIFIGATQIMSPFLMTLRDYKIEESKEREKNHEINYLAQQDRYTALQDQDKETRKVRHDMKMQIISGISLIEDQNYDLAAKHFSTMMGIIKKIDENSSVITGNDMIDANISMLLTNANYKNVNLKIEGLIPTNLAFSTVDLTSLFMNLFQNAFEATSMNLENQYILAKIKAKEDLLYIKIENSFDGKLTVGPFGLFESKKKSKLNHGFGTKSINEIVKKYDGDVEWLVNEDVFKVEISFGRKIYEK